MVYMDEIKRVDVKLTESDKGIISELIELTGIKSGTDLTRLAWNRLLKEERERVKQDGGAGA